MRIKQVVAIAVVVVLFALLQFGLQYRAEYERQKDIAARDAKICAVVNDVKAAVSGTQAYNEKHPFPVPPGAPAFVQPILDQVNANSRRNSVFALAKLDGAHC